MVKFDSLVGVITFVAVIGVIYVLYKGFIAYKPSTASAPPNVTSSSYNAGSIGPIAPNYDPRYGETAK